MNYASWTMIFGIQIDKFPNADYSVIFSHSNSDGYSFIINNIQSDTKNAMFEFRKTGNGLPAFNFITN